jgi:hypothetical protein
MQASLPTAQLSLDATQIFTERLPSDDMTVTKAPAAVSPYAKKSGSPSIAGPRGTWELADRNKIFEVKA